MKVIERLSAAEILFRSPQSSGQPHESNLCHPNTSPASTRLAPFCLAAEQIRGGSLVYDNGADSIAQATFCHAVSRGHAPRRSFAAAYSASSP
jgi:hypothetical protein